MILVRDVFRLKFGKAREAQAAFKDVGDAGNRAGFRSESFRVLVDLVGPYYTLVLETTYGNLAEYEQTSSSAMANQEWRSAYQKFTPTWSPDIARCSRSCSSSFQGSAFEGFDVAASGT